MNGAYEITITPSSIICPACRETIPHPTHLDIGEVDVENAAYVAHLMFANEQEREIVRHFQVHHRFRYWLFMKTGWKRVLG